MVCLNELQYFISGGEKKKYLTMLHLFLPLGIVSGQYPLEESGGPLSGMNEAVNNIDRPKQESGGDSNHLNVKVSESKT